MTLAQLNKRIASIYPGIFLVKGKGYHYIASDNQTLGVQLAALYTTSIPAATVKQMDLIQWIEAIQYVLDDMDRIACDRLPVNIKQL